MGTIEQIGNKGDTLDNLKDLVPKFIISIPLINLDVKLCNNDDDEEDYAYVPSPKVKENKVSKQNVLQKLDIVQYIEAPSSSNNKNVNKGKGEKGRHGRNKK